ncbi:hypothetical protein CATMQ487_25690 [Sphaerotilus microaerophilus]|jgi:hypothetical protein|uniref:Uncharacterized protein n=1 Tax=Sphaerotilus microaerophilus TaxID=2914710 RepID=A0ABM7YMB3_9BURK|nr:hypothetical protein CATMQ487_25690 [Sphaerotilus sp. FB-5]
MRIEIDIYSGRPNPGWNPTPDEEVQLRRLLRRVTAPSEAPAPEDLGYRGFLVLDATDATSLGSQLRVYRGRIYSEARGARRAWADFGGVEDWLRQQAIHHGLGDLLP